MQKHNSGLATSQGLVRNMDEETPKSNKQKVEKIENNNNLVQFTPTLSDRKFLSQLRLTLIGILQSLTFAALILVEYTFPKQFSWKAFVGWSYDHYLHLPFIISSLIIILIWTNFVHASLFFSRWPNSFLHTSLIYLLTLVEVLTFKEINNWQIWLMGVCFIVIIGGTIRYTMSRILDKRRIPLPDLHAFIVSEERKMGLFEIVLGAASLFLFFLLYFRLTPLLSMTGQYIFALSALTFTLIVVIVLIICDYRYAHEMQCKMKPSKKTGIVVEANGIGESGPIEKRSGNEDNSPLPLLLCVATIAAYYIIHYIRIYRSKRRRKSV